MSRSVKTTETAIREYWASTDLWERMNVPGESDLGEKRVCMACGRRGPTQRAHILAASEGGEDEPANLHMLCFDCHAASELLSGEEYWRWFLRQDLIKSGIRAIVRMGIDPYKIHRMPEDQANIAFELAQAYRRREIGFAEMMNRLDQIGLDIRL